MLVYMIDLFFLFYLCGREENYDASFARFFQSSLRVAGWGRIGTGTPASVSRDGAAHIAFMVGVIQCYIRFDARVNWFGCCFFFSSENRSSQLVFTTIPQEERGGRGRGGSFYNCQGASDCACAVKPCALQYPIMLGKNVEIMKYENGYSILGAIDGRMDGARYW